MNGTKRCTQCGIEKELNRFPPDHRMRDGRDSWCRDCGNAGRRMRYAANREAELAAKKAYREANLDAMLAKDAAYHRANRDARIAKMAAYREANGAELAAKKARRYEERRLAAVEIYGGQCAVCGSTDRLEFDHVNGDGAEHRKLEHATAMHRKIVQAGRPLAEWKLQLLCFEHHWAKTRIERWGS